MHYSEEDLEEFYRGVSSSFSSEEKHGPPIDIPLANVVLPPPYQREKLVSGEASPSARDANYTFENNSQKPSIAFLSYKEWFEHVRHCVS